MRKTLFTHLFIWGLVLGFAFTAVAQDNSNSTGKVPMTTEKPTVNYGITNDAPTGVATAYGHAGILGQFNANPCWRPTYTDWCNGSTRVLFIG